MRVTSDFFVAQLLRRLFAAGEFAAVVRRGAEAAGAIFVVSRDRQGNVKLYGPAPQSLGDDDGTRRFMAEPVIDDAAMEARFAREARFDPDFWVVEIETAAVGDYLDVIEE